MLPLLRFSPTKFFSELQGKRVVAVVRQTRLVTPEMRSRDAVSNPSTLVSMGKHR